MQHVIQINEILLKYTELLYRELVVLRNIKLMQLDSTERRPGESIPTSDGYAQTYQACTPVIFSHLERQMPIQVFTECKLIPLAMDMAVKLARRCQMQFHTLPLPKGVYEVAQYSFEGVSARAATCYDVSSDDMITRFDCLVSWWSEQSKLSPEAPPLL